ncbi:MAG: DUF167 domain-containing protein, partial [Desulfobulbaceae bacterium]|nr:DUF167 domain-containing protein [Desulfobulbaceae bacterium]
EEKDGSLSLAVHVQPKASKERVAGLHGGAVKLCITAPPVEGKANEAVVELVARLFHLSKSKVTLLSGLQSRSKRLRLEGLSLDRARQILTAALP